MKQDSMKEELMEQSYFQLFRQVMFSFLNRAASLLKKYDLHPSQAGLLLYVANHEGQTQKEISMALNVKPPTTAAMLTRMEKHDFLFRQQDEQDKRKSRVYLTEYGKEICSYVKDIMISGEQQMQIVFSEKENQHIKEYMARMICYMNEEARREGYDNNECIFSGFEDTTI